MSEHSIRINGWSHIQTATLAAIFILVYCPTLRADEILDIIGGTWKSSQYFLYIDHERMLANTDKTKPFQREPLIIKTIKNKSITFKIGDKNFYGLFNANRLILSIDGNTNAIIMHRVSGPEIKRLPRNLLRPSL